MTRHEVQGYAQDMIALSEVQRRRPQPGGKVVQPQAVQSPQSGTKKDGRR